MRLFVGCDLPDHLVSYLRFLSEQLPEAVLVVPRQYDLTLKFLGSIRIEQYDEIVRRLSLVSFQPFDVWCDHISFFSEKHIRVVWLALSPKEPIQALHHAISEVLSPSFPDTKLFVPHITLARVKSVKRKAEFIRSINRIEVEKKALHVDRFSLVRSEQGERGVFHKKLYEFCAR